MEISNFELVLMTSMIIGWSYFVLTSPGPVKAFMFISSVVVNSFTWLKSSPQGQGRDMERIFPARDVQSQERQSPKSSAADVTQPASLAKPEFFNDIYIGSDEIPGQYGLIGHAGNAAKVFLDLNHPQTILTVGAQGSGKSYLIGMLVEMALMKERGGGVLHKPLAGVMFHYAKEDHYAPELLSMRHQSEQEALLKKHGLQPAGLSDIVLLVTPEKLEERKAEHPDIEVHPFHLNPKELSLEHWKMLMGASDSSAMYIQQLENFMSEYRNGISVEALENLVADEEEVDFTKAARRLLGIRLNTAKRYIRNGSFLSDYIKPGRLVIVDLRDEFLSPSMALILFLVASDIISGYKKNEFNKIFVMDEAHILFGEDKTGKLTARFEYGVRMMRHAGSTFVFGSQDPASFPSKVLQLASVALVNSFAANDFATALKAALGPFDSPRVNAKAMMKLRKNECLCWARNATDEAFVDEPQVIHTSVRVTKHGGDSKCAIK